MGVVYNNPKIVNDSLELSLDSFDSKCYSGIGTYINDLSGNVGKVSLENVSYGISSAEAASAAEANNWYGVAYGPKHNVAPTSWTAVAATSQIYWFDITYGNGKFVAVSATSTGGNDQVMYSTDGGKTWTSTAAAADRTWRGITYGDGKFVAVAGGNDTGDRVMYSTDGITWTTAQATGDVDWRAVTYGDGKFVAVAANGITPIMYSTDGINWTGATNPPTNIWYDVVYGNGKFVAVATNSTDRVTYSTDGINWTSTAAVFDTAMWDSIAYCPNCDNGNGRFVASAITESDRFMNSTDGISWSTAGAYQLEDNQWEQITYGGGYFVAVAYDGTNRIVYAVEGENDWNIIAAPEQNGWLGVAYGGGRFVAVAGNGTNRVMYSNIVDVPNRYVAVSSDGTNRVMYSDDANTWTAASAAEQNNWQGVAYGDGKFVAIAASGTNRAMYSSDGVDWTAASAALNYWQDLTYGNGKFVAVSQDGANRVTYSSDGITWTVAPAAEANDWEGVTYGNGKYVAVARTGTNRVMYSSDAITWISASAAEANGWWSVTYGNGKYVAVSNSGTNRVMYSSDGINWVSVTGISSAIITNSWWGVTYGNGYFVAVSSSNQMIYSPDGINWLPLIAREDVNWNDITYGDGKFVAVAEGGTYRVNYLIDDIGKNFSFDGLGSSIKLEKSLHNPYQKYFDKITIESWTKLHTNASGADTIISKSGYELNAIGYSYDLRWSGNGTKLHFEVEEVGNNDKFKELEYIPDVSIQHDWLHICATYDGNYGMFYLNGEPVAEGFLYNRHSDWEWRIGKGRYGNLTNYRPFRGLMSVIRLYSRALTDSEIKQNFNSIKSRYGY